MEIRTGTRRVDANNGNAVSINFPSVDQVYQYFDANGTVLTGIPIAGSTNNIGSVNGNGASVEVVATVTAGAYTAGKEMGQILTFANILPANFIGTLASISLKFKGTVQTTEFDVAIFSASPAGTFSDNATPVIAAADTALLIDVFPMVANFSNLGTHTIYSLNGIGKKIVGSSTSLFAVVTTKGVPTNPASTSEMSLRIGMEW